MNDIHFDNTVRMIAANLRLGALNSDQTFKISSLVNTQIYQTIKFIKWGKIGIFCTFFFLKIEIIEK